MNEITLGRKGIIRLVILGFIIWIVGIFVINKTIVPKERKFSELVFMNLLNVSFSGTMSHVVQDEWPYFMYNLHLHENKGVDFYPTNFNDGFFTIVKGDSACVILRKELTVGDTFTFNGLTREFKISRDSNSYPAHVHSSYVGLFPYENLTAYFKEP